MLKRVTILALLLQLSALAALGESKEGICRLKWAGPFDKDVFTLAIGDKIKGTCKFSITDFLGKEIINANVSIVNTADKAMHCQYYVAFFDEQGTLLGCAGQGTFGEKGLAAGETTQLGSCLIPLPAGLHEKAVRYKIAFYESDKEIGKDAIVDTGTMSGTRQRAGAAQQRTSATARKWTDATGEHTVDAEFVELKDGIVRLKTGNGKIIGVPLEKLSAVDREYLGNTIKKQGGESSASNRSKRAGAGSGSARSKPANTNPQQAKWYSAGPGWAELERVAHSRHVQLQSSNHGENQYEAILSQSQPGATIVLLFALDNSDKNIPDSYQDLLPIPWAEIEAKLQKGETVEASGQSRDRKIILLAAPNEPLLRGLIRKTKILPQP